LDFYSYLADKVSSVTTVAEEPIYILCYNIAVHNSMGDSVDIITLPQMCWDVLFPVLEKMV